MYKKKKKKREGDLGGAPSPEALPPLLLSQKSLWVAPLMCDNLVAGNSMSSTV